MQPYCTNRCEIPVPEEDDLSGDKKSLDRSVVGRSEVKQPLSRCSIKGVAGRDCAPLMPVSTHARGPPVKLDSRIGAQSNPIKLLEPRPAGKSKRSLMGGKGAFLAVAALRSARQWKQQGTAMRR